MTKGSLVKGNCYIYGVKVAGKQRSGEKGKRKAEEQKE